MHVGDNKQTENNLHHIINTHMNMHNLHRFTPAVNSLPSFAKNNSYIYPCCLSRTYAVFLHYREA